MGILLFIEKTGSIEKFIGDLLFTLQSEHLGFRGFLLSELSDFHKFYFGFLE